jgi:uncharacterized protein (TIGR02996 family)
MAKAKARAKPKPKPLRLFAEVKGKLETFEILLTGKQLAVTSGALHTSNKAKKQTLATPDKARAKYDAIVAEKRAAGFRELGEFDPPTIPVARHEALEAAIREDRTDPGPYLVYADWLQAQGSPVGEMLVLAQRKKPKQAAAIAKQIGLPLAEMVTFGWRYGVWQWMRLENDIDWMESPWDPSAFARALFASPLCMALEELRIGILRWDHNDQPGVLAEAGRYRWANDLQKLHLGDVGRNIDMAHHTIGDVGKVITKSFPNLVSLKLHSGSNDWSGGKETFGLAGIDLPKLKDLVIETCAMTPKRLKALTAAKLPKLERLELWFGAKDRDGTARTADVAPILDRVFPKVVHLGLRNSELVTDLVRLLPASKLARQLVTLDLSMGTMDDSDAAELASAAKSFPALKQLDVGESYVDTAGMKALKAAFKGVKVTNADPKERYDWNPEGRYVSVHE